MKTYQILLFFCLIPVFGSSQNKVDSLVNNFNERSQIPEENIHLHLNKSVYVKGEDIGYTAYVIDQRTKQPSLATTNLYVQLLNDKLEIIDEKLLLIEGGVGTHVFETDNLTIAGDYTIKAFTNWMRNFEDPLFAQEPLKILDPDVSMDSLQIQKNRKFELTVLPEGGHAVDKVFVKMGAILKDQFGNGIAASGSVIKNGEEISKFSLDENGIGSFLFLPDAMAQYQFQVELSDQNVIARGLEIDERGVAIAVTETPSKLFVNLRTNEKTLLNRKLQSYAVTISNDVEVKVFKVNINDKENLMAIGLDSLSSGINQISYFSENRKHLGDRLYFKREGLNYDKDLTISLKRDLDSLEVSSSFNADVNGFLSISALPGESMALPTGNILGKFYLEPYLKGIIQNPNQYFEKNDRTTNIALDNLLLTQGWSMHDWSDTSNRLEDFKYAWESGIAINSRVTDKKQKELLLLPGRNSKSSFINVNENEEEFFISGFLPMKNESLRISALNKKGKSIPAKIYPRFFPSVIPDLSKNSLRNFNIEADKMENVTLQAFNESETLDEVVVKADKDDKRKQRIKNRASGRVDFFDDEDRRRNFDIVQYLLTNGLKASFINGRIFIKAYSQRVQGDPIIILNGQPYFTTDVLLGFNMAMVDYIEIDTSGTKTIQGRSSSPIIRIEYDPNLVPYKDNRKSFSSFEIPLTFEMPAKFYTPTYFDYSSNFFKKLGVIDWQGKLQIENGKAEFTMPYVGQDTMWFIIEGMSDDGTLIHSVQQASVTQD